MLPLPFKQSDLYQNALQLAKEVYRLTENFPDNERMVLVYTLRRLAVLLCQDVATGIIKKKKKQQLFFEACLEHCIALDAQLELAAAVKLVEVESMQEATRLLKTIYENVVRLLPEH